MKKAPILPKVVCRLKVIPAQTPAASLPPSSPTFFGRADPEMYAEGGGRNRMCFPPAGDRRSGHPGTRCRGGSRHTRRAGWVRGRVALAGAGPRPSRQAADAHGALRWPICRLVTEMFALGRVGCSQRTPDSCAAVPEWRETPGRWPRPWSGALGE